MINERACATDETCPADPVTIHENRNVSGYALCADTIFQAHLERTKALRDRQARYLDSLPTEPSEVIQAAIELLHPDGDTYPAGIDDALHLSLIFEAMVSGSDIDFDGPSPKAMQYVAARLVSAMQRATDELDRIGYILRNPRRVEFEQMEPARRASGEAPMK